MQTTLIKECCGNIEINVTRPLIKNGGDKFIELLKKMTVEVLLEFNELNPKVVNYGLITTFGGLARSFHFKDNTDIISISINPEMLSYFVLGHEFTHFAQKVSDIPNGEKACDVYTVARSDLFLDRPPSYLKIPVDIREKWDETCYIVRELCIKAIEKRKEYRNYIQWLESEIKKGCVCLAVE